MQVDTVQAVVYSPRTLPHRRIEVGQWNESRELVAVAVTTDGRRVSIVQGRSVGGKSVLLDLVRSLVLGLLALVGLITGSRREPGGRRGERR